MAAPTRRLTTEVRGGILLALTLSLAVNEDVKAVLISRPRDFGVLEDHWNGDALFLPLPGGTVASLHQASLKALGVTEVRVLRCHPPGSVPDLEPLEKRLAEQGLHWTVRAWPVAPWPDGLTLSEVLLRQSLFLNGDSVVIFSVPAADPRGWTGPQVPTGFPLVETRSLKPLLWDASGTLKPWDGPVVALGGTRDFFRASIRFLETLPPSPLGLSGIHRQADLQPPLLLGTKVRAASHSRLGPLVQLADGSRLDSGTSLSRTLVLTPTHFTGTLHLADRIVVGDFVVEPFQGGTVPLPFA